jgi:RNA polymerase sigma-70 factor (ECF subfamily)
MKCCYGRILGVAEASLLFLAAILSVAAFQRSRYNCSLHPSLFREAFMNEGHTTVIVQHYLNELAGDAPSETAVRALLDRSVRRLHLLCATMLYRSYPRLTQPPLNLRAEEVLSAVVERLLKALREVHPPNVRQFFALASQHMRWELNEMARRLDERQASVELCEGVALAFVSSDSGLSPNSSRMLDAIADLPEEEREAFDLVRIQGLSQAEAGEVLGVSAATVNRRLNRGLRLLQVALIDLRPEDSGEGSG